MRWDDWYDALRVGDEIVALANNLSCAPHTVLSKGAKRITLRVQGQATYDSSRKEFLTRAVWGDYRRVCRNCKRLKDQHGLRGKCLFGPRKWD